jgi:hypothetical protein
MSNYSKNNTSIGLVHQGSGNPFWQVSICFNDNDWFVLGDKFVYNPKYPDQIYQKEKEAEEFAKGIQGKIDKLVSNYETLYKIATMLDVECNEKDIINAIQCLLDKSASTFL